MTALPVWLPGDLLTVSEYKWGSTLATLNTKKPINKVFARNSLNTTNRIILWKVGTVACQKRIQTSKYFPQCLIFTIQGKNLTSRIRSSGFLQRVCVRLLSPWRFFLGELVQDTAAQPQLWVLHPGRTGKEGDVVVAKDVPVCEAGQCQVPLDGLLRTCCDGYPGYCADGQSSGNAVRTRAGGFALWKNHSDLQVPRGPGCLLVCLVLTWPKRSCLSLTLGKMGGGLFIAENVRVQWHCSLTFMPLVLLWAFFKKEEAKVCCGYICTRGKGGTSACEVKLCIGLQLSFTVWTVLQVCSPREK